MAFRAQGAVLIVILPKFLLTLRLHQECGLALSWADVLASVVMSNLWCELHMHYDFLDALFDLLQLSENLLNAVAAHACFAGIFQPVHFISIVQSDNIKP